MLENFRRKTMIRKKSHYAEFRHEEEADAWIDMVFQSSHNGKIDEFPYYIVKRLKYYELLTQSPCYEFECVVEYKLESSFHSFHSWIVDSFEEALPSIKDEIYAFEALESLN
jgi:hypothetical protein